MTADRAKGTLSPQRRDLVELMTDVRFGRVEGLVILDGEPVLSPPPRVLRDIRFGRDGGLHPMRGAGDFALRRELVELFAYFDASPALEVEVLEVQHGLPFRMVVAAGGGL